MAGDIFLFSRLSVPQGGWHPALLAAGISPAVPASRGGGLPEAGARGAASRSRQVFKKGNCRIKAQSVQGCPDTSHLGKQQRGRG